MPRGTLAIEKAKKNVNAGLLPRLSDTEALRVSLSILGELTSF
jgi:hypothetical protein